MMARFDITPSGFRGSDLLLRQGMRVLGSIRSGTAPMMTLVDGKRYFLQEGFGLLELVDPNGGTIAQYSKNHEIKMGTQILRLRKDPYCADWVLVEDRDGLFARCSQNWIEIESGRSASPALILFLGYCLRESLAQIDGTFWLQE